MTHELTIQAPDGSIRNIPLRGSRLSIGRSVSADICFAEDTGLSRQHLALQRDGDDWTIEDLGSKNGTFVNGSAIKSRIRLRTGDRVTAGRLLITFNTAAPPRNPVVVFDGAAQEVAGAATYVTSLEGALTGQTRVRDAGARGAKQMEALIKAGRELARDRSLNELFQLILDLAVEAVGALRGVVMTLEGTELVVRASKGEGFRISAAVRDRVLNGNHSVLVRDTQLEDAFRGSQSIVAQRIRTLMAVPLQTGERMVGLIYVDSPTLMCPFNEEDLNLLTVMANVAAIRIEHARLAEIEQAKRLLQRDLDQAAEIQRGLLPAAAPAMPGLDVAGYNAACRTVGGDYYDFIASGADSAMLLGDVSGKGMSAALLMVALQARVQVVAEDLSHLGTAMTRLNKAVCANCPANRFITLFFCAFDPARGLRYACAGHNPPMLVRADGSIALVENGGPPLGIVAAACYEEYRVPFGPGEMLVIYSDGVTEATNAAEEEFGEERLAAVLRANRQAGAEEVVESIRQAVAEFAAGAPAADDLTIVVARRI